ncbi:MAG: PQQ-binding-like beta-propeller repeat protein [Rhodothermaceae bacterium]|nr:PQQ-binding-like beta-propeller repeat protein [Rhodothermaceae bacterium]
MRSTPFLLAALILTACTSEPPILVGAGENWDAYLGHPSSNQYSFLDQITKENVGQLEVAWVYETGDSSQYQSNNLIIDGILYTATPTRKLTALNAATGEALWTFDPNDVNEGQDRGAQRGLMYWEEGDDRRIYMPYRPYLFAINAESGDLVTSFGTDGYIHLGEQMDLGEPANVGLNTPGYVYDDMIIIGAIVSEDVPGAVRAFDVRTGERKWIFHTLPRPGQPGSETWPEGYLEKTGGASDWSGLAIDTTRGIVYSSTETAGPDFYGGDRYGENLYANSLIALDAHTGERLWHHQFVHHDLWDMDNPTPPTLLTVTHEGKKVDVVAQGTKMGFLYVFDRETGEPLWPIEEIPQAASKLPDMKSWPTQPAPTKPPRLMRDRYTEADVSTISPEAEQMTTEALARMGTYGSFPPPSLDQTIIFPGYDGGFEWGGNAADPDGILYVNVNEIPWFYQLVPTASEDGERLSIGERYYRVRCASCHGLDLAGNLASGFPPLAGIAERQTKDYVMQVVTQGGGRMPAFDHLSLENREAIINYLFGDEQPETQNPKPETDLPPYIFRGFHRWFDDEGYPAIKPPWGTLNAVDLNTGEIKWKVPLGEYKELTERGIPPTGTENYGGPIVTASGLIFIGATADETFRAFDKETGEILWEHDLPFGGNATPSTYMVDGKQYVVISAGGAKSQRPKGGSLVAFSLP